MLYSYLNACNRYIAMYCMNNARSIHRVMSTVHGIASPSVKPAVSSDPVIHATVYVRSDRADGRTDGRTDGRCIYSNTVHYIDIASIPYLY